MTTVESNLRTS